VGLTAVGCLTKQGHSVVGVDVSESKIKNIAAGVIPISEPGLKELIDLALDKKLLAVQAKADYNLLSWAEIAIICVGTPSASDGSHNMTYIAEVTKQIAELVDAHRKSPLSVVYRSTIRPGSIDEIINPIFDQNLGESSEVVELVYNPEFLRESTAIKDYFEPPKIIIGTSGGMPSKNVDEMYAEIEGQRFYTKFREAEFTKFVDNTFHALKVSFANEIGRVCLQLGIDAQKVHEIFVSDRKLNISPYYLRPGGAFGGSCLPKDVRALQYISTNCGANTHVIDSLIRSNEAHKHYLFNYCTKNLKEGARVLMLGIAFKSATDDLRESPHIDLARKLLEAGHSLSVFDPSLDPSKLVGQNLGWAYGHLPSLSKLLVTQEVAEGSEFDLVVDTNGSATSLSLSTKALIDINTL
jgi:GDP-mannose 6-dehydrogenase